MATVIVTGGAGSIGTAIIERFAKDGNSIAIADIDGEGAREKAATLSIDAIGVEADVSDRDSVHNLIDKTVSEFGTVDVLVNNAGVFDTPLPIEEQSIDDWEHTIDVNLKGAYLCSKLALPHLRADGGGSIVNIASIVAVRGFIYRTAYGPSKAGIINLTRTFATELSEDVRVNAVSPGFVRTERLEKSIREGIYSRENALEKIPQNEFPEPEHIADAVAYLSSDRARSVSGVTIPVDGGQLASL